MFKNVNLSKKGISLIVLIITVIVIIILAGAIILSLTENNLFDSSKKARFFNDMSTIEESASLKYVSNYGVSKENSIPNLGKLTNSDKDYILNNIPTLDEAIKLVNNGKDMYSVNLYWLDSSKMNLSGVNSKKKYLIDMDTLQPYDYEGEVFFNKRWHTIRDGIFDNGNTGESDKGEEILPSGWMRLILYYPEDSIERQWRLSIPGEIRDNLALDWKNYTEPILLKIDQIKDVMIRYSLNGEEITVAPPGKIVVDINATPKTLSKKVDVSIKYEDGCINKHYKVGNSGWKEYTAPFVVTENTLIQARAEKKVDLKDTNNNIIGTTTVTGNDKYKVTNIGVKEENITLKPPVITKVAHGTTEVAKLKIDYPTDVGNIKKVYKINSGEEVEYTTELGITEYGTEIIAYYYTLSDNKKSPNATIKIEDETKLDVKIYVDPNPIVANNVYETDVIIEYDDNALTKTYSIDGEAQKEYTR